MPTFHSFHRSVRLARDAGDAPLARRARGQDIAARGGDPDDASLSARIDLADGASLTMRPVFAADADAEQAFVRGLSADSRQLRFHVGIPELGPDLLRRFTDVDQRSHVAVVVEAVGDDGARAIVADARYVRGDDADDAEFALTIADAWQHRGLGPALIRRLLAHAASRGLRRLHGDVLRANAPMVRLARKLGGRFVNVPGDGAVTRAVFDL